MRTPPRHCQNSRPSRRRVLRHDATEANERSLYIYIYIYICRLALLEPLADELSHTSSYSSSKTKRRRQRSTAGAWGGRRRWWRSWHHAHTLGFGDRTFTVGTNKSSSVKNDDDDDDKREEGGGVEGRGGEGRGVAGGATPPQFDGACRATQSMRTVACLDEVAADLRACRPLAVVFGTIMVDDERALLQSRSSITVL